MNLTVILCTYNRRKGLIRTLRSLQNQYSENHIPWEVLVVDNNSTDNTFDSVREFAKKSDIVIRYVREEKQGLSYARNRGIKEARGQYVHFIEDDESPD
jgi:glycosyltransferase involved in cell wall biosynthesis